MNRILKMVFALLLSIGILTGCQSESGNADQTTETEQNEQQEMKAEVVISKENGEEILQEKEIEFEEGQSLMEVMKANFEVEESDGFITGVEGVSAEEGEEKAWFYTINGEEAMVGANDYELESGDQIAFDFHAWE
ncbi:DUF4430 domain-containing protein [Thalassobacillus hwangdonensis]|uniref:DUF4430 domain-containing protein n=1 Tax=Thalassobacillus hwangdonensis TaxID=546108 RepID=A0ABW3L1P5_9BACI